MNRATLEKLAKNPHYKMSDQQLKELRAMQTITPMVIHTQEVEPEDDNVQLIKPRRIGHAGRSKMPKQKDN